MHHYMEFDPYLIEERNRQIFQEVRTLQLEKRLRQHREGSGPRLVAYFLRLTSTLHPLRRMGTAGR
jgi:predicted GIY-YIG superfamily endonuclease